MTTTSTTSNIVNKNMKVLNLDNSGFENIPAVLNNVLINL
jgi:hypothetical protein